MHSLIIRKLNNCKKKIALLCFFLTLGTVSVQAHEGHYDQLGLDEAIWAGEKEISRLVNEKVIVESWKSSAKFNYDESDMQTINGKKRWVIAYENAQETDPSKRLIEIILTPMGKFVSYEFINKIQ